MKIGDYLYCHTTLIMNDGQRSVGVKAGKYYKVVRFEEDNIIITSDFAFEHQFAYFNTRLSFYEKWFYSPKKLREYKLKKLKHKVYGL